MTITELVEKLNNLKYKYGDLDVRLYGEWPTGSRIDYVGYEPGDKPVEAYRTVECDFKRKDPMILPPCGPYITISY